MSNVIPISRGRLASQADPQTYEMIGPAFCLQCGHAWEASAPAGVVELECPRCRTMKGLFRFRCQPGAGQLVMTCNCGNQLFYLTPDGHLCANCGSYINYE